MNRDSLNFDILCLEKGERESWIHLETEAKWNNLRCSIELTMKDKLGYFSHDLKIHLEIEAYQQDRIKK